MAQPKTKAAELNWQPQGGLACSNCGTPNPDRGPRCGNCDEILDVDGDVSKLELLTAGQFAVRKVLRDRSHRAHRVTE